MYTTIYLYGIWVANEGQQKVRMRGAAKPVDRFV